MKIQNLAIIFIIIIFPISLILTSYTKYRVETIGLQAQYDTKLNDATHDALKAYQINSFSNDTGDLTNSKIRDIKASVNTFFNSMATNFSSLGYTKNTLQNYVPAIVYTMYDGYYIYSPFKNTWDNETVTYVKEQTDANKNEDPTYEEPFKNNEKLYGLKPYVYYSCRYIKGSIDVVITYSLDNYIQVQGTLDGKTTISRYGYLLEPNNITISGDNITYRGGNIFEEKLEEYIYVDGDIKKFPYIKKNGVKYYYAQGDVFTVLNGTRNIQNKGPNPAATEQEILNNKSAKEFYREAKDFTNFIITSKLFELTTNDIVDMDTGVKYSAEPNVESPYVSISGNIFDINNIEEEDSNFNTHRIDVIKNSIERNLSIAISNFNNYTEVTTDFQMPKLKDTDWDGIMNNISIISFFQGANIGGKVYNGYSIIANTKNEDVVMEDSIYIKTRNNLLCNVTEDNIDTNGAVGIFNINAETRAAPNTDNSIYYMPVQGTLSYNSVITKNNLSNDFKGNLKEYINRPGNEELKRIYYTALARERYGLYRPKLEI